MSTPAQSWATLLRGHRGAFLLALLLAEFGAAMQGIAYSTVLPVIARELDGYRLFGATLASGPVAAVAMLAFTAQILRRVRPGLVLFLATAAYLLGAGLSVGAPSMEWVLVGTFVRGVASGLFGGFGLGAVGDLYDERERPRVMGLFSLVWLLPSLVGPALNGLITQWADWRWAVGWPAVVVVLARVLMGRRVGTLQLNTDAVGTGVRPGMGLGVAAALAIASWGSTNAGAWGVAALVGGSVVGALAIVGFLRAGSPSNPGPVLAFAGLCATHFGAFELLSLTVLEGIGADLLVAAVAVSAGLVAWCLVALKPQPAATPDPAVLGPILVTLSYALLVAGLMDGSSHGIALVIAGAAVGGAGMGSAYPLLISEPFDQSEPAAQAGAMVAFAETAATAWVSVLAGGLYSTLHGFGLGTASALVMVFAAVSLVGVATVAQARARRS